MAKIVSTIAPIEQLRGNLSGRQTLKYKDNNNSAFDAPEGKQYATNYRKSYIGCLRASDGLAYFQVKTKNCVNVTAEFKKRMAVSGGAFAIVASIMRQKTATAFLKLVQILGYAKLNGEVAPYTTMRQFISEPIMNMLAHNLEKVTFSVTPAGSPLPITQDILNPWGEIDGTQTTGAEISDSIIQKFWMQLFNGALQYKVGGTSVKLLSAEGVIFRDITNSSINTLNLSVTGDGYMYSDTYQSYLNVTKSQAVDTPFTVSENDDTELVEGAEYYLSPDKIEPQP